MNTCNLQQKFIAIRSHVITRPVVQTRPGEDLKGPLITRRRF